jgi:hypothetical protein
MAAGTGAGVKVSGGAGENFTPPSRSLVPFLPFFRARLAGASLLVVAVGATAAQGYLPVVGPPPLRFQLPPVTVANQVILPPLAVVEPPPNEPEANAPGPILPSIPVDSTNPASPTTLLDPLALTPGAPAPVAGTTNVVTVNPSQPEAINPQVFMKYFAGQGTNAAGVITLPPIGFVPPVPIVPPSSSATFQTVPPGKP